MTLRITRQLRAYGRVQGVWFRESMRRQAAEQGVGGWVRNRSDGSVEAMLHGPESAVHAVVEWARSGPPGARVDQFEVTEATEATEATGEYGDFEVRPSA